jgi:plasmid maintenance system killer protein
MIVRFADAALLRCYQHFKDGCRRWNKKLARAYISRINLLKACNTTDDLRGFPQLRFHPLDGPLAGKHAMNIDERWRLIMVVDPTKRSVTIEEVSNHYGD